ncbi:hypothetical protein P43SY_004561 [Pythium insidiosum]|uniref:Uncharacterized protein n=1 Tax=Pythium insidiosum TaxID=114742 RepID=A0AAD5M8N7_PYTIN|nr:hypothetical protein P43SY_004561 [Pythium insidiosum]
MWAPSSSSTAASSSSSSSSPADRTSSPGEPSINRPPTIKEFHPRQPSGVWTYDAAHAQSQPPAAQSRSGRPSGDASPSAASTSSLWSHHGNGVIGANYIHNHVSKSRLLWNRSAPEEEEREEEALPSYLTYLQPAFRPSSSPSSSSVAASPSSAGASHERRAAASASLGAAFASGLTVNTAINANGWDDAVAGRRSGSSPAPPGVSSSMLSTHTSSGHAAFGSTLSLSGTSFGSLTAAPGLGTAGVPPSSPSTVEAKSQELAWALQEFVRQQVNTQLASSPSPQAGGRRSGTPTSASCSSCQCEPLKARVSDLEQKLLVLQQQMSGLLSNPPPPPPPPHGHHVHVPAPPLPPLPATPPLLQPPLPPAPPSGGSSASMSSSVAAPSSAAAASGAPGLAGASSAINDRVSTLEGRQSAFQSQLAQISKVLGVPIGKHGKNSQLKTLVQSLRDEIDTKLATVSKDVENKCLSQLEETITSKVRSHVDERMRHLPSAPGNANGQHLSYDAVLGALAEEHEATLTKLSSYFEDRLAQESSQRSSLESRMQRRLGEQEEWLQQLEGEFGSWHDTSSSVSAQLRVLHNKVNEMEGKWLDEQGKWDKVAADVQVLVTTTTTMSSTRTSGGSSPSPDGSSSTIEALTRTVHHLQSQHKQLQGDLSTETTALREHVALMDTWVQTTRQETRDLGKTVKGMKQLVEKLVRDTGSAEDLLQQYVSTITHQVASVTRQYVSVRIRDNNRMLDATLRARIPAYAESEAQGVALERPAEKQTQSSQDSDGVSPSKTSNSSVASSSTEAASSPLSSFELRADEDDETIQALLLSQRMEPSGAGAVTPTTPEIMDKEELSEP